MIVGSVGKLKRRLKIKLTKYDVYFNGNCDSYIKIENKYYSCTYYAANANSNSIRSNFNTIEFYRIELVEPLTPLALILISDDVIRKVKLNCRELNKEFVMNIKNDANHKSFFIIY